MQEIKEIYRPIENDLRQVRDCIALSLKKTDNTSILRMGYVLLDAPGKRIRPALVILSAKTGGMENRHKTSRLLIKIAAAVELIHMASLLHDDVIDRAHTRHNKPTINSRWGKDIAIALGDFLFSLSFGLISETGNPDIVKCMSRATKEMCEGELMQVCERDNLDLLKKRYFIIIKKKTASLFAASCHAGSIVSRRKEKARAALRAYGLNVGLGFQIADDYLDLVGKKKVLGKPPGQDLGVSEMTLPILHLLESTPSDKRASLKKELAAAEAGNGLNEIRSLLRSSGAAKKTEEVAFSYLKQAKSALAALPRSIYLESLFALTGFIIRRGFRDTE